MKDLQKRKVLRLQDYDYSQSGAYFLTICAKDRNLLFGKIIAENDFTPPKTELSTYGQIVDDYIKKIEDHFNIDVDNYVIMPNHIHLLVLLKNNENKLERSSMIIPKIVESLKKLSNKESGVQLWQTSYYDHIIRDNQDYLIKWQYIESNPAKWLFDQHNVNKD